MADNDFAVSFCCAVGMFSSMIITMDMLENMLAEASSTLDALAHLSPETAGGLASSSASAPPSSPAPCRSNISTPSPQHCDDFDQPTGLKTPKMASTSSSLQIKTTLSSSDVLSTASVDDIAVDVGRVKALTSPLFSMEESASMQQPSEILTEPTLSPGKSSHSS